MQKRQLYKQLSREYDRKRTAARAELEARRNEIYEMLPRIKEIDAEIAAAGFSAAFSSLENPAASKASAKEFKEKCDALTKEKNAILKENGIPRKYLEIRYECKICGDTGYSEGKECVCFRQRRIAMTHSTYKMKERLENETFDSFDFRFYSSKKPEGKPLPPKKNMEKIVKYLLDYTGNFEKRNVSLLFYGEPGLGKTFLCNSIAKELMDKGHVVVYTTAYSLFKLLNDAQFGKIEDGDLLLEDIMESELLIIDDVGTEFSNVLTGIGFFNILNSRALNQKPVIISTNLDPEGLKKLYSERVYSRITGDYRLFEFYGEDIRALKKFGRFLD